MRKRHLVSLALAAAIALFVRLQTVAPVRSEVRLKIDIEADRPVRGRLLGHIGGGFDAGEDLRVTFDSAARTAYVSQPLSAAKPPEPYAAVENAPVLPLHSVRIERLGQSSPQSEAAEVWLIAISAGQRVFSGERLQMFGVSGATEFKGKMLGIMVDGFAISDEGALSPDLLEIRFRTNKRSGRALVSAGDRERIVDLYSPNEGTLTLRYEDLVPRRRWPMSATVLLRGTEVQGVSLLVPPPNPKVFVRSWKIEWDGGEMALPCKPDEAVSRVAADDLSLPGGRFHAGATILNAVVAGLLGALLYYILAVAKRLASSCQPGG